MLWRLHLVYKKQEESTDYNNINHKGISQIFRLISKVRISIIEVNSPVGRVTIQLRTSLICQTWVLFQLLMRSKLKRLCKNQSINQLRSTIWIQTFRCKFWWMIDMIQNRKMLSLREKRMFMKFKVESTNWKSNIRKHSKYKMQLDLFQVKVEVLVSLH